jgi:hypothetical protein
MFRLHETTNRRVCRWAFMLLCAAPTLAIAAWIGHGYRPWRLGDEQRRLGAALHVDVRLADWREPRPGAVRTASVELADPTEAVSFVRLAKLEHRRAGDAAWLTVENIDVDMRQFSSLAARLHLWLAQLAQRDVRFRCQRLILHDSQSHDAATYRDVEAVIRRSDGGGYQVQFVAHVDTDAANPPRLRATLASSPAGDVTHGAYATATLDATNAQLPLWLMAVFAPLGDGWGQAAVLAGTVRIDFLDDDLHGVATGQLKNLDLAAIAAASGSHRAEGQAEVELDELRWQGVHVERVAGVVHAESIRVSPSVIAAATDQLFCGPQAPKEQPAPPMDALLAVDSVSCRFVLDSSGLALTGTIPEAAGLHGGCIAAAAGRPLLITPPHPRLHPSTWVQFIARGADGWVPGTREAIEAASRLPLPTAMREAP